MYRSTWLYHCMSLCMLSHHWHQSETVYLSDAVSSCCFLWPCCTLILSISHHHFYSCNSLVSHFHFLTLISPFLSQSITQLPTNHKYLQVQLVPFFVFLASHRLFTSLKRFYSTRWFQVWFFYSEFFSFFLYEKGQVFKFWQCFFFFFFWKQIVDSIQENWKGILIYLFLH